LAVQDAVAAANILWKPLKRGKYSLSDLQAVQDRRMYPTVMTQSLQLMAQNNFVKPTLTCSTNLKPAWEAEWFNTVPFLRAIPAILVGIGFRPEHVRTPDVSVH
jgi:hypothetical protein